MQNNWQTKRIGEILTLKYGKGLPVRDRLNGSYPVIGSGGILGYHVEPLIHGPGIVVGRKGSIGTVLFEKRDFFPIDTVFYVELNTPDNDLKFIYYMLLTLNLNKLNSDAAVPGLNRDVAHRQMCFIPLLPNQRKIATILSAYDDLIENNLRRIKILEETAQNLYTEWFVKFRFPGREKVKMVDSPLGKIPEGWYVRKLNDVLITIESGSRPKGGINTFEREIPSIGAENILGLGEYDYLKEKYVSKDFFNRMTRGHIKDRDVLLYKDGAQIGRKAIFGNGFPHSVCCINEHVFILRVNNQISQGYLYFWLDQPEMTQNIKNLNANSAQPGINQVGVKALPILIPTKEIIVKFDELCEPLLSELFLLAKENNILRKTRDLLLPKLISGELDVLDLDIKTGDDE